MDSVVTHLQAEINARTAEILQTGRPGFEPEHADVRTAVHTTATVSPLSAAAPGDATFVFYDAIGRRSFSRDGEFTVQDGVIKNREGKSVLGFTGTTRDTSELHVDPRDLALGRVHNLHVESDGAVCYTRTVVDPNTIQRRSERVTIGTLALARFPAGTELPNGGRAPFGVEPYVGRAGDGNFGLLKPGHVDASRIDLNRALDRMHDLYSQLEAVTAANQARAGTDKAALDLVK